MNSSKRSQQAFTAPHQSATQAGMAILQQGGSAIEAMVAAAAAISVVYPHMTGFGGDGFWLIHHPDFGAVAFDGCGRSAALADASQVDPQTGVLPSRGGGACLTQAGAVSGMAQALAWHDAQLGSAHDLPQLLSPAMKLAQQGFAVSRSLANASQAKSAELQNDVGFREQFMPKGETLQVGQRLTLPNLAHFFRQLSEQGLSSFYQGDIASIVATHLQSVGSPLRWSDFVSHQAQPIDVLHYVGQQATWFNLGAPTQGIASLLILAQLDWHYQTHASQWSDPLHHAQWMHCIIEATKQAFDCRDQILTDATDLTQPLETLLTPSFVQQLATNIHLSQAKPWRQPTEPGDTVWMGAVDRQGVMVSYIQSLYWEFGAGVVVPELGLTWNNRGTSFSLDPTHPNHLRPNAKPLHTLNPALALLPDGRRLVYGTMGGDGQPQTQAAIAHRIVHQHLTPEAAIAAPRWLLGRTWGDSSTKLKLEQSLYDRYAQQWQDWGHDYQVVPDHNEMMGHAGAIVHDPEKGVMAATDPRCDGLASVANG